MDDDDDQAERDRVARAPVESRLDPSESHFIAVLGRKGTGKSLLAHRLFTSYPYDRVVIDFHRDTGPEGPKPVEAATLTDPLPTRFPAGVDGERVTLRYIPDPAAAAYADDLDRVVGLAYSHPRTCLWIDEIGELTTANTTLPHLRRALQLGRHRRMTLIMAGPRPVHIDPLCLAQADYVYCFDLPNPRDRARVADSIGWSPNDFSDAMQELTRPGPDGKREQHRYLRYDARQADLIEFPPLPIKARMAAPPPETDSSPGPG